MTELDTRKGNSMGAKFNLMDILNQRSVSDAARLDETAEMQSTEQAAEGITEHAPEIQMMDVYDLIPSRENFYHVDDTLKRSIEIAGVLQPLLVKKPEDGKYRVIAGHRRRLAAIALLEEGKEQFRYVPCVFKEQPVKDRLAIIMANRFRDKTDWEKMIEAIEAEQLAREIKAEYSVQGRTRDVLAEITGVSAAQLGRYKAVYNNLSKMLMEAFKRDQIGFSVAAEVCGLSAEWQTRAEEKLEESGALSLPDVKELKKREEAEKQIPGQYSISEDTEETTETDEAKTDDEPDEDEPGSRPGDGYEDMQPETIISLCYSCDRYEMCSEKKSAVQRCRGYVNREEARKTEEQRYNEEQARLDRETQKKLREREQAQKMQEIPKREIKVHEIKLASMYYEDVKSGKKSFELRKNDRHYKEGDKLRLMEFSGGKHTGRAIEADIIYMLEDYTGLTEGYCILGIKATKAD